VFGHAGALVGDNLQFFEEVVKLSVGHAASTEIYLDPKYDTLELSDCLLRRMLHKVYVAAAKSRRQKHRREVGGEEVVNGAKVRSLISCCMWFHWWSSTNFVCVPQVKGRVRAARKRLAGRWRKAHAKAVVDLGLTEEDAAEGLQLLRTAFVPEIVPSAGSLDLEGPHYVYHMLPWVSDKARLVFQRAHEYAAAYPDAMPVVHSLSDSVNPLMCAAPAMAPRWAVKAVGD
jgi:hypothetical protein